MHQRLPLPGPLDREFSTRRAVEEGVSRKRLENDALGRPFFGVRTRSADPPSGVERLRAARVRLRPWQAFGSVSAALVWGLPTPGRARASDALVHVVSPWGSSYPKYRGSRSHRIDPRRLEVVELDGLRVTTPVVTWMTMARDVDLHELVAAGDALVTEADNYPELSSPRLATLEELAHAVESWTGMPGIGTLRAALPRVRERVESPMETKLRLMLVDAGFPEPEVGVVLELADGGTARLDLAFRDARIGIEYDGEYHFGDGEQVRVDLTRADRIADTGWRAMRVSKRDLFPSPRAFFGRLRRAFERAR